MRSSGLYLLSSGSVRSSAVRIASRSGIGSPLTPPPPPPSPARGRGGAGGTGPDSSSSSVSRAMGGGSVLQDPVEVGDEGRATVVGAAADLAGEAQPVPEAGHQQ